MMSCGREGGERLGVQVGAEFEVVCRVESKSRGLRFACSTEQPGMVLIHLPVSGVSLA